MRTKKTIASSSGVSPIKDKKYKVLMVATEASPYVSVGGAGSVVGHLSKALHNLGHDVRVFIPKFGLVDEDKYKTRLIVEGLRVPVDESGSDYLTCNIKLHESACGVPIYFLENQEYYEKRANVYGYSDDPTRFVLLCLGALEFIKTGTFIPDVIHCNDWHTGALPNLLKTAYRKNEDLSGIATVFTIHNLAYQGTFDHKHVSELDYDDGKSPVAPLFSSRINFQNFMRRGILYADAVNTVSKTYAKEILTPEFGEGLNTLLLELKGKLFGIVNGIDYDEFNPHTDALIEQNYDINTLEARVANKFCLQREYDLPKSDSTLVFGFVGRLDYQKGVDLLVRSLYPLLKEFDAQFVQVGGGDWGIVEMLQNLKSEFPQNVGIHTYPNFTLPRSLFSGCDCIIYPSRFEPCGVVQIEAMRYGAVPIVRKVGGLADTVIPFNSETLEGNGLVFTEFNEYSLFGQLVRAHELFKNKALWRKIQTNAMSCDFSWTHSASDYSKLYERACTFKLRKLPRNKYHEDLVLS